MMYVFYPNKTIKDNIVMNSALIVVIELSGARFTIFRFSLGKKDVFFCCSTNNENTRKSLNPRHGGSWVQIPSGARIFFEFLLVFIS